ncbi:MAG: hypothetical protein GXP27_18385 [Planctomycetes bacterium]|nr:hypothetical protein [Planctomycetota bacterium]
MDALPELVKRLGDKDAGVRFWAAKGLANLGPKAKPAVDALKGVLTDPSGDVRVAAAQALCRAGRVDLGLPALVDQLEHGELWVRVAAADAIDYLGEAARPAIPALRRAVADTSRENRYIRRVLSHTLRVCGAEAD